MLTTFATIATTIVPPGGFAADRFAIGSFTILADSKEREERLFWLANLTKKNFILLINAVTLGIAPKDKAT